MILGWEQKSQLTVRAINRTLGPALCLWAGRKKSQLTPRVMIGAPGPSCSVILGWEPPQCITPYLPQTWLVLVPLTHSCWDPQEGGQPQDVCVSPSVPRSLPASPACTWSPDAGRNFSSVLGAGKVFMWGHIGCLGWVCSVFMSTSQGLLNDLLLLCIWEVGPTGLGEATRQWHGHQ